jgi:peroxiredoxin
MKKIVLLVGFVLIFCGLSLEAQTPDARGYIVKTGQKAPDFTLRFTDGKQMQLKDLEGQVVLLQFTASWCGVCRKEMPFIEKDIWQVYKDKGLKLFGIDRGEPLETVKKFATDMKITYPLLLDEDVTIFTKYADKNAGVTRNVLIDKKGNIVFLTRLFDENEFTALKKEIARLFL